MKKTFTHLALFIFFANQLQAQWITVNIGTTQDLYSVDYYSSNDIWIGSFNQFAKTNNAGTSWSVVNPLKDPVNANISPANLNDIAFTGGNTAIATGFILMGNTESILQTNNGGTNWSFVSTNNTVPLARYLNAFDVWGTNVLAVGNNGRIGKSINNGLSWGFVASGTTKLINDVKYISSDTVIAAGDGVILKSVNGGANWTSITTYSNTSFKTLSCKNNVIYIASEYDKTILKSVDYGVSYTTINLPFNSTGVIDAINKDTLLAAATDGLYVSKTGGQYWEKYSLTGYQSIKMIDHLTPNTLFAVGNQGYAIKTANLALAPCLPICNFSVQSNPSVCLNDSVVLVNQTAPLAGYTYQWKHNGIAFSNQLNSGIKLTTAGTHTLSLAVTNNFGTTTKTMQVMVTGHELNPFTIISSVDTLCSYTNIGLAVPNSDINTRYQFRKGFTNLSSLTWGTGNLLAFQTPYSTYSLSPYNIKATLTNACYTDSIIQSSNFVISASNFTYISTPSQGYCANTGITNVTLNDLNHTTTTLFNNYFNYSCCKGTTVNVGSTYSISITSANVGGEYAYAWVDYNNDGLYTNATDLVFSGFANNTAVGTITIPNTLLMNQKLRLRIATDDQANLPNGNYSFGCGQIEDYYIVLKPGAFIPTASYNKSASTLNGCVSNVSFTNTAYNAETILWNFGDGTSSTLAVTSHTFNPFVGSYTVSLIACNVYGCDTSKQVITLTVAPTPSVVVCTPTITNVCFGNPKPAITKFQKYDQQGLENLIYYDNTCSKQFTLEKDSTYYFVMSVSNTGYLTVYADLNNDGVFTPQVESITEAVGYMGVNSGWNGLITLKVPNFGIDSVPLRIRAMVNTTIPFDNCNLTCGDYKDFTLYTSPHKLQTIFSTPTTSLCNADSVSVFFQNYSKGASSYLWHFGDGKTSTLKEPTHTYTTSGVYDVKLVIYHGTKKDSLTKTNYVSVNLGINTPSITLLGNVLSTTTTATSYQWYKNSVAVATATNASYSPTLSANYYLSISNSFGCTMASNSYSYFPLTVGFNLTPTVVCTSNFVNMIGASANASQYYINWGDGSPILFFNNSMGLPLHTYSVSGTYTVQLKGCNSIKCDSVTKVITSVSPPSVATIQYNLGVLTTTTTASNYQWYFNSSLIPSATSNTYAPISNGNYYVRLSNNASSCFVNSSNFSYYAMSINYSADTVSYCGVNNAEVLFTDASLNATNYFWDFGDGATSTIISPLHTYSNSGTYSVKLKVCNNAYCDSLTKSNYITVSSVPFTMPVVSPSGTVTSCYENLVMLTTANNSNYTYQWKDGLWDIGGATSYSYDANNCSACVVAVTNSIGCISSSEPTTVNYDYYCVWPGDANNDLIANNIDVLELGLQYGSTGATRTSTTNAWQANLATDWLGTISNGENKKFADCNGDGVVNANDTLAIYNNYGLQHNFKTAPLVSINEDLTIIPDQSSVNAGTWGTSSIYLGSATSPVNSVNGLAFSIEYYNWLIETDSIYITYPTSFINAGQNLRFQKNDFTTGKMFTATTHTNNTNVNGYGKIATLHYKISPTITSSSQLEIFLLDAVTSNALGNITPISAGYTAVNIDALITNAINYDKTNVINIFPNPVKNTLHIDMPVLLENATINIYNSLGQLVIEEQIKSKNTTLTKIDLNKGLYTLEIVSNNKVKLRSKLIKE